VAVEEGDALLIRLLIAPGELRLAFVMPFPKHQALVPVIAFDWIEEGAAHAPRECSHSPGFLGGASGWAGSSWRGFGTKRIRPDPDVGAAPGLAPG
jgi:hypothetical protein